MQKEGWSANAPSQFPQDQSLRLQHKTASPDAVPPVVNYPEQQYPEQEEHFKGNMEFLFKN